MVNFSVDGISTDNVARTARYRTPIHPRRDLGRQGHRIQQPRSFPGSRRHLRHQERNQYLARQRSSISRTTLSTPPLWLCHEGSQEVQHLRSSFGGPGHDSASLQRVTTRLLFFDYEGNRRSTGLSSKPLCRPRQIAPANLSDICGALSVRSTHGQGSSRYIPCNSGLPLLGCGANVAYNYENFQPTPRARWRRRSYRPDHHLEAVRVCALQPQRTLRKMRPTSFLPTIRFHPQPQSRRLAYLCRHAEAGE